MTLSRILCAVDFSEPAQTAFRQALALTRAHNAELAIVMAVPKSEPFSWRARERTAAIAALRRASDTAGVRMRVSVQHGNPAGVILLHAHSRECDLIVLGTHGRTGFERLRSRSVAERVARRARCPVLVVPMAANVNHQVSGSFRNVVCPIDFSEASRAALEQALQIVEEGEGRLTLVHVLPMNPMNVSRYAYHFRVPEYAHLLQRDAWQRLQDVVPTKRRATTRVRARVVSGAPADEIARMANAIAADLIVMGVTSRGAIGRTLFGSTAARVMRSAGRPLLAVPERMRKQVVMDTELSSVTAIAA